MHIKTEDGWQPLQVVCSNHNKLEGVYRPTPLDRILLELTGRRDRWSAAMQFEDTRRNQFSGDHFNEPLFGAFGEEL